jgi:signal transduction histidine kinase
MNLIIAARRAGDRSRSWLEPRRAVVIDGAVAVITTAVEIGLIVNGSDRIGPLALLLTLLAGAALPARRRAPLLVLLATAIPATVLAVHGDYPQGAPVLVALYTVAERRDRRSSLIALAPTAVLLQADSISSIPVSIGAWALGAYVQARQRYTAALEDRAAQLEREREQLNQLVAQQERASVARELHDIVAHSVTVMLLGVRGARDVLRAEPELAERTLDQVESSAEQSLAELRRILLLLRHPDQQAEVRPPPTLAQLDELVEGYRQAGLPVRLQVDGPARPLPSGVELSAYRIVEEALTNVLKHATPTRVGVGLRFEASRIELQIEDAGGPARPGSKIVAGHGIAGMRERAAALGGVLEADPFPGGGFRVTALLPTGEPNVDQPVPAADRAEEPA